ncbi:hypothetical protein [Streptomyces sp. NBC_01237]|uniref:hypothetical protein n=1 Tax=Streptomyces sp. NBC_01237 TaxID=2903790 RepID=UPI002DDB73BA|nr:hypothetical protein [Streptomyces sp. NBC_01237]WRZ77278.1 hypothetical protein OG251_37115 [Streptomyces sp. NBC_01237]
MPSTVQETTLPFALREDSPMLLLEPVAQVPGEHFDPRRQVRADADGRPLVQSHAHRASTTSPQTTPQIGDPTWTDVVGLGEGL